MKTLADKKVNQRIKKLNKQIREDVFGDRFYAHQKQKARVDGISYYLYEFIDRKNPEATIIKWYNEFELLTFQDAWLQMNDLIVNSDFWATYNK